MELRLWSLQSEPATPSSLPFLRSQRGGDFPSVPICRPRYSGFARQKAFAPTEYRKTRVVESSFGRALNEAMNALTLITREHRPLTSDGNGRRLPTSFRVASPREVNPRLAQTDQKGTKLALYNSGQTTRKERKNMKRTLECREKELSPLSRQTSHI